MMFVSLYGQIQSKHKLMSLLIWFLFVYSI
jgi:hypothetical protein